MNCPYCDETLPDVDVNGISRCTDCGIRWNLAHGIPRKLEDVKIKRIGLIDKHQSVQ